eukprot:TRINITY_DN6965_c0_g1_i3.p1 TRINITY_DN6965_c0_g1~~TRINITY_DN6965_c0_g1_i3.p1  ORF type:complete len:198 (-),score=57.34 TRINITY_DN6965_c0_g1_i3:483-1076(-)
MLKQLAEKIDKVRQVAGNQLQDIFVRCKSLPLPEKSLLELIFVYPALEEAKAISAKTKESLEYTYLPWRNADYTYERLVPLIDSKTYKLPLLEGWIISSGGITESTLRASSTSLMQYLAQASTQKKGELIQVFTEIVQRNKKVDRVLVPLITTIGLMYQGNYLSDQELVKWVIPLFKELSGEIKSKNILKVISPNQL